VSTAAQVAKKKVPMCFKGKSFCFTGALAGLKRTAAEREVRSRGGLSMKDVNSNLDYLVVGEKGSAFWKHGSYGTKIETARELSRGRKAAPRLIPESEFMLALGEHAPEAPGDIHSKVFVANYDFLVKCGAVIDAVQLQNWLVEFRETHAIHVQARTYDLGVYQDLFDAEGNEKPSGALVQVRFVKQMSLDESPRGLAEEITKGFEAIQGVDGHFNWFEKVEGSTDHVRLIRSLPEELRIGLTTPPSIAG
jgi:hypothetical protein